ncbi:MAG TPA: extracellular solute-binding protein [Chloroflexota bacterium]|nr:extracellular solute-binding protein [Chloroflexota bacterium]
MKQQDRGRAILPGAAPAGSSRPGTSRRTLLFAGGTTALAGAGLTLLAACGGSQAPASGGAKTLPPATIGWDTFRGGDGSWPELMIKTFQEKYSHIKVEYRPIALDGGNQQSAYPKMLALAQANSLGEVHAWDPSHWQLYQAVKRNIIRPIDEYIARDKYDLGQFYRPFIEYQKWQGKTWGLPSWGWTGQDGLLYNTELAQQAGVTFPAQNSAEWSMDRLYDISVRMGRFVERNNGFGLSTTLPGAAGVTILCRAFNVDNLSPDGKKSTLMDSGAKEAMRWVYELAHREKVVAVPGRYEGNLDQMFVNGLLGIQHAGSLSVFTINRMNRDGLLKFKSQLFPKRKDGKRPSQLRGGTWNVSNVSKYPDQGWEFVKHITSREGCLTFNTMSGNQANVRPDIMNDEYFQDPNFKVFLENFENTMVHVIPANLRGTEFEAVFGERGTPWYKGEVGFEDGLKQWNDELQRVLDLPEV